MMDYFRLELSSIKDENHIEDIINRISLLNDIEKTQLLFLVSSLKKEKVKSRELVQACYLRKIENRITIKLLCSHGIRNTN